MSGKSAGYKFDVGNFFPKGLFYQITDTRVNDRDAVVGHAKKRKRRKKLTRDGKLIILAADHPGRRVTSLRNDPIGMGDRYEYLGRVLRVITDDRFDGVMGTTDMIEDIIVVDYLYKNKTGKSFLDDKVITGCMNRGGHAGSLYELEDDFTSFTPQSLRAMNLDGGKMMYRLEPSDRGSIVTIQKCAAAVTELARLGLYAFIEPVTVEGRDKNYAFKTDIETLVKDVGAAAALGETSLNTWLKISYNDNFERVARATTLPILLLGGPAKDSPLETIKSFGRAMKSAPNVRGAMVGRNVTFVQNEDPRAIALALSMIVHEGYTEGQALKFIETARGEGMDLFNKHAW
ncbi:MAG TPA: aldolase [Bacteroidota bacterium]|nr:aldolase [Bacteroidota bacterium]